MRYGKWIVINTGKGLYDYQFECSRCHSRTPDKAYVIAPDYCPHCGADMCHPEKVQNPGKEAGVEMFSNGISVTCLPDSAFCKEDPEHRSPLDLSECPRGHSRCDGDCPDYSEDPIDKKRYELTLHFGSNRMCYKTDCDTAKAALMEFQERVQELGVYMTGMTMTGAILYDHDGLIDEYIPGASERSRS